jgi:hypothetical protein
MQVSNHRVREGVSEVGSSPVPMRTDAGRIRRLADPEIGMSLKVLDSLRAGEPLHPPMTRQERIALAVTSTQPTHHLSITSPSGTTQEECAHRFRLLIPRVERNANRRKGPLVYVGSFAKGRGNGGYHVHLLLWEEPWMHVYRPQCRAVGLGRATSTPIGAAPETVLQRTSYVLGQQVSVFGTKVHQRHLRREKGKRGYVSPQMKTLAGHHPKLFYALTLARDQSVTDETLIQELPIFI